MIFTYLATVLLAFVFVIWSKTGIANLMIKMVFLGATILGVVNSLIYMGVIAHGVL
jgi:hypothetical protein